MDMAPTMSFRWVWTDADTRVLQQLFVWPTGLTHEQAYDETGYCRGNDPEWRDVPEVPIGKQG